ncbi:MAG: glycosyltransferase [candidate division Zixibacteria bacterium]|nr:glycosyltransferase [candidate division Zixibacteria bacterium]
MSSFPKVILGFLMVDWPLFMRRKMLYALAEAAEKYGSTVVAVNRPLCQISTIVRKPQRARELLGDARLQKLASNLYLYSPRYFIHDSIAQELGILESLNLAALRSSYRKLCKRIGIVEEKPLIWFYHPVQGYVTRLFPGSFNVYEIYDNLADIHGNTLQAVEKRIDKFRDRIDLLLTTSRKLHDKYSPGFKHAWEFGNGIDRETYERMIRHDHPPHPAIDNIASPRIGYTGLISQRLDWQLIHDVADRRPDWNLVFVGKVFDKSILNSTANINNIHFTGAFDHSEMPSVLRSFDVGFMPYRDNDFFRYSNPLKIYEYAATGLKTVSSNMEELSSYPSEIVKIVPNRPDDWIEAIQAYLESDDDVARSVGAEFAGKFIWEDMTARLLDRMQQLFQPSGKDS